MQPPSATRDRAIPAASDRFHVRATSTQLSRIINPRNLLVHRLIRLYIRRTYFAFIGRDVPCRVYFRSKIYSRSTFIFHRELSNEILRTRDTLSSERSLGKIALIADKMLREIEIIAVVRISTLRILLFKFSFEISQKNRHRELLSLSDVSNTLGNTVFERSNRWWLRSRVPRG